MLDCIRITGITTALFTNLLYAGTMGIISPMPVCVPGISIVPCATTAWDFSLYALYLKPAYGNGLIYNVVLKNSLISNWLTDKPANWDWGLTLEGSYHFNTGNDLTINWYHFDEATTRADSLTIPSFGLITPATYTINPKWNAVNIELGQIINYGENKSVRFYGGVQSARLDLNALIGLSPVSIRGALINLRANGTVKYPSLGPRLGIDLYYNLMTNFGLYANAAGTILFGNGQFYQTNFVNNIAFETKEYSKNLIVPEFEGKVGAQLIFLMDQSYLSINLGYMLVDFIAGIDSVSPHGVNNVFSLSGAYFGAKWVGSM